MLPDVTSLKSVVCAYGKPGPAAVLPVRANVAAMIGELALVPPTTIHPVPSLPKVSKTATPVFGSATAETSASMRLVHPVSVSKLGFAMNWLQPEPPSSHAVSVQPRVLELFFVRLVPPAATTNCDVAGNAAPKPLSPELAVIRMPGWLKYWVDEVEVVESSPAP